MQTLKKRFREIDKSYLFPIIVLLFAIISFSACLGFTEIDSERSWCYEKNYRADDNAGIFSPNPIFTPIFLCGGIREKYQDETQAAYDAYKNAQSERCKSIQVLSLYLYNKKYAKCGKINPYRPTLHEPTAIIEPQ